MNLRQKLTLGFFAMAVITFIVSGIAYWQTERLSRALYEIGVVRLPSIQALDVIFEAKTSLDASKRELMRPESYGQIARRIVEEEMHRQDEAWKRTERAWALYEPLPRSREEDATWQKFVPTWKAWRTSYEKVMHLLLQAETTGDASYFIAAEKENQDNLYDSAREARVLLEQLIAINEKIAEGAKTDSIASIADMKTVRLLIVLGAVTSLGGALACGIVMSRIIGRPITKMSEAFARISGGDLNTKVNVASRDEIGAMAEAMNGMVDSLRDSELRFRAVFENTFDAIGVLKDWKIVFANPPFLRLFGYTGMDEIAGRHVGDFVAPRDRPMLAERIRIRTAGGPLDPTFGMNAVKKDGSEFIVEIHSSQVVLNGEAHTIAVTRDVTDQRRAAAQLAEFAGRLEVALHTSKLGVWRRNVVTREAEWDRRMFEIFGLSGASAAPGREELMKWVHPEDRETTWKTWNEIPEHGRIYSHRFRIVRPDGELRHIEVHGMMHEYTGGPKDWAIGVAGDITPIVDATAESARLREQLLQSEKMKALGTFSSGIAHDFNNFLTAINGFIDLARSHLPSEHESADMLDQAKIGADRAATLVKRILNFSRQARSSERTEVNLGTIATETTALISASIRNRARISLEVGEDIPNVLADAGQVQQILMNLCTNGVHAIGDARGGIRVELALRTFGGQSAGPPPPGCRAGTYVCMSVADTGCGMDAATVARIFDPYFTTKAPGKGTGLGLSVVKDIMAAHEGGLEVTSEPGKGTEFRLYFPVAVGLATPA